MSTAAVSQAESPAAGRSARPRWAPTAAAMGMLLLVYALWQILHWPAGHRTLVGDVFFYPVSLASMVAAFAAGRRCSEHPRLKWAWLLCGLGAGSYLVADIAQTIYELNASKPYPSVADAFYLLFYPLMLGGLLLFPSSRRTFAERIRLGIDLAIVALGGGLVVFYVVLGPTVIQTNSDILQTVFSIAYPVGDLILIVGLASVLLRTATGSTARALQWMAAALLVYMAGDLVYGYITLHGTYQGGDPVDSLWMVGIALFAVSAAAQNGNSTTAETAETAQRLHANWAPFLAVAVGFGLLLFNLRHDRMVPDGILLLGAVGLAILVSGRQFLAQRDLVSTQDRLSYQSLHDALTGLPNRALVIDRAEQMLARSRRTGLPIAALYVDIDGFKQVNDTLGHATGDELLRVVAARLSGVVRECDTVGRLGGDEFIVLLEGITVDAGPELVAERICEVLSEPLDLGVTSGRTLSISASVGIAQGQRDSADVLLRDADFALYEAKEAGKNRWAIFESHMQTAIQNRLELEMDLRHALGDHQFFLLYQPTFDLRTEQIRGVEALLRWRHPSRGVLEPGLFIALAEESGLIIPIGRWVLKTACIKGAQWRRRGHQLAMSINVSARQLDDSDLVSDVAEALEFSGLEPSALTLEITETALMRDPEAAAVKLLALKELGVRIAIDDFGTGYSSLAYLRQLPVDAIKIDRPFISGIAGSTEARTLIHTLVQLGKTLGLETLGEGIEEQDQLRHLQDEHCDFGQGFLFARPLEPEAVEQLLDARSATSELTTGA